MDLVLEKNLEKYTVKYSQVTPQLATFDSVVDVCKEYNIEMNNTKIKTFKESFKTFLPKPHRRDGKFKSLKHKRNSSIDNRWVHEETRKNQIRFYNEVRSSFVDFRIDGLNTLRYNELELIKDGIVTKSKIEL